MPVVAALKFHDFVAPRVAARQADGRHRRLRARRHQAQTLHAGHNLGDGFGDDDFRLRGRTKRQPAQRRLAHRFNHLGMRVSHNRWPPRANVINITLPVFIPHKRPLRLFNKARHAAHAAKRPHRRVHATGDDVFRPFKKLFIAVCHDDFPVD